MMSSNGLTTYKNKYLSFTNKIGQNILINIGISDQYVNNKYEHGTITINDTPSNIVMVPLLINDKYLFL